MNDSSLTTEALQASALALTETAVLPSGALVAIRPLAPSDAAALGAYFVGLSPETRGRFGPHPLDRATAEHLCASIDPRAAQRVVLTTPGPVVDTIIAYIILLLGVPPHELERYARRGITLDPGLDCAVAPSVADGYQNVGIGSRCFQYVIGLARRLGRRHMVLLGGTQGTNERAVHFYAKHGFQTVGSFEHPGNVLNHDMLLEISPVGT
jgi:GNAT superfamily N-acetyltransferase